MAGTLTMRRAAFAALVGVSKQMISKYASRGLITEIDGDVDVSATLDALAGRLDETRRLAALAKVVGRPEALAAITGPSGRVGGYQVELRLKRTECASAGTICLQFNLTPNKASALARLLAPEFETMLGVFGEEMAALAAVPNGP